MFKGLDNFEEQFAEKLEEFFKKLYPSASINLIESDTRRILRLTAVYGNIKRTYLCIMDEKIVLKLEEYMGNPSFQETVKFRNEELKFFDRFGFELDSIYEHKLKQDITDWFGEKE